MNGLLRAEHWRFVVVWVVGQLVMYVIIVDRPWQSLCSALDEHSMDS